MSFETDIIIANTFNGESVIIDIDKQYEKYLQGTLIDDTWNYIPKAPKKEGVFKLRVRISPTKGFLSRHPLDATQYVRFTVLSKEQLNLISK